MPNQRSILSFFGSSSSTELPKPQPQLQPKPAFGQQSQPQSQPQPQPQSKPPPPPPPPSFARFVPPPSARNGIGYTPPPGMGMTGTATAMRMGGSPEPNLVLAPITPAYGRSILVAGGASEEADGRLLTFPSSSSSSHHNKIVFPRDVHMPDLVSVNGILLPVRYADSFYKVVTDTTRLASLFNRIILGDDGEVVGGVVCRLEPSPFTGAGAGAGAGTGLAVYIQSLALLSPYRGRGLMAAALDSIEATVQALNQSAATPTGPLATTGPVLSLFAHVWTEHDDALQWYASRQFARQGSTPVNDYYFALRPSTAWIVRRDVAVAGATNVASAAGVSQLVLEATQKAKEAAAIVPSPPPPPSGPAPLTRTTTSTSTNGGRSQSYQNSRPETEWNDLPADMMVATGPSSTNASASASVASSRNPSRKVSRINLADGTTATAAAAAESDDSPPPSGASTLLAPPLPDGSQASSRSSSSTGRKKRAYPAAMFQ